jgi:tRNA-dihydrouridine synthase
VEESGMDGAMIGRGIFGNPWFFSGYAPTVEEKLSALVEHTLLFEELFKSNTSARLKNFEVMKKHYKAYVSGFDGAKELRMELMEAEDAAGIHDIVQAFLKQSK